MNPEIQAHIDKIRNELHELSKSVHSPNEWVAFNDLELALHGLLSAFTYELENNKKGKPK